MIIVKKYNLKIYDMMLDVVPRDAVFVGRPMTYVNPYSHVKGASLHLTKSAKESVDKYREYVSVALGVGNEARRHLKGKDLSCNCGEAVHCHAIVVMELANEPAPPQNPMLQDRPEKVAEKVKKAAPVAEVLPKKAKVAKVVNKFQDF